jgi:hypothetical protein
MLLYGATTDRPFLAQLAAEAGADVHINDDFALRSAAFADFRRATKVLLGFYSKSADKPILVKVRAEVSRFNRPRINDLFDKAITAQPF